MSPRQWYATAALGLLLAAVPAARAQRPNMNISYVYPAGGTRGSTFEAVVAGQFLTGVSNIYVSGGGVRATVTDLIRPITFKEFNDLRIKISELLARRAVVRNDFSVLERFRGFRKAKDAKSGGASDDEELEKIKQKYAGATWTAEDEKLLRAVRKKLANSVRRPANPAISELAVVQVTVDADAEPGRRELRVGTPSGVSNPLVFCVGRLPEFSEEASKTITQQKSAVANTALAPKKRNTEAEKNIALPAVVNGQILPGEADRYRFNAMKGQRLIVAASARELIPYIPDAVPGWFQATLALYDAKGKELAYEDDYRFHPDPVLRWEVPADGEYVVEIKDAIYRGREDFVYRITIGELPFVTSIFPLGGRAGVKTDVELSGWNLPVKSLAMRGGQGPGIYPLAVREGDSVSNSVPFAVDTLPECLDKEPNDRRASAQQVALPVVVNGRIDQPDDWDVLRFQGRAGEEVVVEVQARRLNSPLDSLVKLTDATGSELARNDDHDDQGAALVTHQADSYLRARLPADGTYYLHLGDMQHKCGPEYAYRLRISPPRPDFDLRVVPSTINARAGATVPITVNALRKDGFSGEIALALKDAPDEFVLSGGRVPVGQDQVRLTLTAGRTREDAPVSLHLEGRAVIEGREVIRKAVPVEEMTQAFAYRHLVPAKALAVAVAGHYRFSPSVKILSKTPLRIPASGTARLRISVPAPALVRRVDLELDDPPQGITIKDVVLVVAGAEIVLQSDAAKVKPGLGGNLIVTALAKLPAGRTKANAQRNRRRIPVATLPAIPFEVVAP